MAEKGSNDTRLFAVVWIALLILTGTTVAVSYVDLGFLNVVVALLIASAKASLVALFFMHLKYEKKLLLGFALAPLCFLFVIMSGTLLDTLFRR